MRNCRWRASYGNCRDDSGYRDRKDRGNRDSNRRFVAAIRGPDGRLVACRKLSVGGPDLSLRQPAVEKAAHPRRHKATLARPLGNDPRLEFYLCPPEPADR